MTKDITVSIPVFEFSKYKQYFIRTEGLPSSEESGCTTAFSEAKGKIISLFQQIRIVPKQMGDFFNVEIVYEKEELNSDVDINRVASLDLGVNNLITLVDNSMGEEGRIPVIINGRPIKSINQFYNKTRAEIQREESDGSLVSKLLNSLSHFVEESSVLCVGVLNAPINGSVDEHKAQTDALSHFKELRKHGSSSSLRKITNWRTEKISSYMHKASRFVINYCISHKIGQIVIGKNPNWKQEVSLGKRNNQNFVCIPFDQLVRQIQYKARLVGIKVTLIEESYTSKCSALDLEEIGRHEDHAYAGKRVKRGLFLTKKGILLNADVNGALNILRKAIGDNFLTPVWEKVARMIPCSGVLWQPVKVCF